MRQGTVLNRIVMLLLLAAILLYFGGAAWQSFQNPFPTHQAYAYSVDDAMEATGYLVREEQVISGAGSGAIVRTLPSEGEKVAAGSTVAVLYDDKESVERWDRLEELELEAEQLRRIIEAGVQADPDGKELTAALLNIRSAVEDGDFTRLETQTSTLKSAVLLQSQRHGTTDELSAALKRLEGEIEALSVLNAQSTGSVPVSRSGIFSGQTDGFESLLTPDMLKDLTPSALDALNEREVDGDDSALGKLITDTTWYFVCPLSEAQAGRLTEGRAVTVRFSHDWSGDVDMTVERIGAPENGRVAVVLSSTRFLSDVTLLRRQTVELVFSSQEGIRVPTEAVRMDENGVTGVYVQVSAFAEFKPVEILSQGDDFYLVRSPRSEGDEKRKVLRSGDMVIVASEEIWDGMVIT